MIIAKGEETGITHVDLPAAGPMGSWRVLLVGLRFAVCPWKRPPSETGWLEYVPCSRGS